MKKTILLLTLTLLGVSTKAQNETPEQAKTKIEELNKQKAAIEAEISKYNAMLPKPVVPNWIIRGNSNINFGQTLLGDWAAGGTSNLNMLVVGHIEANYKKGVHSWENGFDGKLGFMKNFDPVKDIDEPILKNNDLLQLSSKYLYDLRTNNLKVGLGVNFISQFTNTNSSTNSDYLVSTFLAPATLDISPGIEWGPLPYLKVFLAPASGRFTFVTNDTIVGRTDAAATRFGNDVNEKVRSEFGTRADITFEKELIKNLVLRSRLQLFNNWSRPQAQLDKIYSTRANIDVNWQTDIFYKITKNIAVNFGFQTIKDDDVRFTNANSKDADGKSSNWQIRENFGVGMVFGF